MEAELATKGKSDSTVVSEFIKYDETKNKLGCFGGPFWVEYFCLVVGFCSLVTFIKLYSFFSSKWLSGTEL